MRRPFSRLIKRHAIKKASNDADLPVPPHVAFVQYDGNAISRRATSLLCGEIPYLKEYPSSEIRKHPVPRLLHIRIASMQRTNRKAKNNGLGWMAG
jgi:hypothetical protein